MTDGTVKCWGHNNAGQLGHTSGIGEATGRPTPVTVAGLANVTELDVGNDFSCALTNGTVKCWGLNSTGQLGGGAGALSSTPVLVQGL